MTAGSLTAWIEGVGLLAPGLTDWSAGSAVLAGRSAYQPAPTVLPVPTLLPPAERRRASRVVKLVLAVGMEAVAQAQADAADLTTVLSASGGDGHNCHALCETLASNDRLVSPTRFHNSVHNTAAGYWDIATGSMAPSQVLCAYDASFAAGLLEALVQTVHAAAPVLSIGYDTEYPEPLHSARPIADAGGIALLLAPTPGPRALAKISAHLGDDAATTMRDPGLERLRLAIPALRGLPLLDLLARGERGAVSLEYLAPQTLTVELEPC